MRPSIFQGMTYTQTFDPELGDRNGHFDPAAPMPAAMAVAFVEWACAEAVRPYLDAGERSIGTRIALDHQSTSLEGPIEANVELIQIEGRKLRFKVIALDAHKVIGRGLHERVIIDELAGIRRGRGNRSAAAAHYSAACA
jgi:predicted thioesterase